MSDATRLQLTEPYAEVGRDVDTVRHRFVESFVGSSIADAG
jgi:hypothetical protein